jgi:hypothetical protein
MFRTFALDDEEEAGVGETTQTSLGAGGSAWRLRRPCNRIIDLG